MGVPWDFIRTVPRTRPRARVSFLMKNRLIIMISTTVSIKVSKSISDEIFLLFQEIDFGFREITKLVFEYQLLIYQDEIFMLAYL